MGYMTEINKRAIPFPMGASLEGHKNGQRFTGRVTSRDYNEETSEWGVHVYLDGTITMPSGRRVDKIRITGHGAQVEQIIEIPEVQP